MSELSAKNKLLVGAVEAAAMMGCGRSTFWARVRAGRYPAPVKDCGSTRWRVADLECWEPGPSRARERMPRSVPLGPGRDHLYRHFDRSGTLLYVGISFSALHRLAEHKQMSDWFWSIARVEVVAYRTREIAMQAEQIAIRNERPLHNVVHRLREAA